MNGKTLLVLALALVSCKGPQDHVLQLKVIEQDYRSMETSATLAAKPLPFEVFGVDDFQICDSLLLASASDANGMLKVISLNSDRKIADLCLAGRARNEFNTGGGGEWMGISIGSIWSSMATRPYRNTDGDMMVPMAEVGNIWKEVNITKSLAEHTTVIDDVHEGPDISSCSVAYLGPDFSDRFECDQTGLTDGLISEFRRICPDGQVQTIPVFSRLMSYNDNYWEAVNVMYGHAFRHPSEQQVVFYCDIDYLLFFDFENNRRFAIHQKGTMTFDDTAPDYVKTQPTVDYWINCAPSNDFFLMLTDDSQYDSDEEQNAAIPYILVFDWSGKCLKKFCLNKRVHRIEYDRMNQRLIGLNLEEEQFWSFDLKGLL